MASPCILRMRNLPWILRGWFAAGRQFAGIARAARRLGMGGHFLRTVSAAGASCGLWARIAPLARGGLGLVQMREKVGLGGDEILRGGAHPTRCEAPPDFSFFLGDCRLCQSLRFFILALFTAKWGTLPKHGRANFSQLPRRDVAYSPLGVSRAACAGCVKSPDALRAAAFLRKKTGRRNVPPPGKREESKSVRKAYWARRFSLTFEASLPILSRR